MATRTPFGRVELWDDFLLSADLTGWNDNTENSGTAAISANVEDGYMDLITGTTDGNRSQITGERVWRAESGGPLIFEAGVVMITAITLRAVFAGFTDVTTIEMPIEIGASDALTTTASDAVGFSYDTASDADRWFLVGVDSDVDAAGSAVVAARFTQRLPVAGTDQALRMVISPNGEATFYINGLMVNTGSNLTGWLHDEMLDNAVSANVNLCPTVLIETRSAAAVTGRVDYIYCHKGRNP